MKDPQLSVGAELSNDKYVSTRRKETKWQRLHSPGETRVGRGYTPHIHRLYILYIFDDGRKQTPPVWMKTQKMFK